MSSSGNITDTQLVETVAQDLQSGDSIAMIALVLTIPGTLFAIYKLIQLIMKMYRGSRQSRSVQEDVDVEKAMPQTCQHCLCRTKTRSMSEATLVGQPEQGEDITDEKDKIKTQAMSFVAESSRRSSSDETVVESTVPSPPPTAQVKG